MTYTIKLAQFEGPFDLLLFFIERDELDVYNIPIAQITDEFLAYIKELELLNIDMASEFILVASTLMRIKAKMLIPRKELDEEGNEIDPREELVQRLLEYKRFKGILDEIQSLEEERALKHDRGSVKSEMRKIAEKALIDVELESLSLFKIMKTYQRLMDMHDYNVRKKKDHRIFTYNYTLGNERSLILDRLAMSERLNAGDIFATAENRVHMVFIFLGILELYRECAIDLVLGEDFNNFWITRFNAAA